MADVRFSGKLAAEFVGTAALVVCGPGTAAATGVIARSSGVAFSMAQSGVVALAFMMVIITMIYTVGHISGCHINSRRRVVKLVDERTSGSTGAAAVAPRTTPHIDDERVLGSPRNARQPAEPGT
jgi:glycerol uptake facilitator-like aquaporin